MERIKHQNKTQIAEKVDRQQGGVLGRDGNGRFGKGNLEGVGGPGNSKKARSLTQQLISFLHEEVKEISKKDGKELKTKIARVRKTFEALWQLSVGWNGTKPDLEAIKFMFERIDGPMPKLISEEAAPQGDRSFHFTLKIGNPNLGDSLEEETTTINDPKVINGYVNGRE